MRILMACTAIGLALSMNGALAQTTVDPAQTGGTGGTVTTTTTGGTETSTGGTQTSTGGETTQTGGTTTTTGGTTTTTNPNDGAFARMSPGNQKITEALFNAQKSGTTETPATAEGTTTGTGGTQSGTGSLSLDDIAARKQSGEGFGVIFKDMKAEGLVDAKNLGQLVSGKEGQAAAQPAEGALEGTSGTSQTDGATQVTTAEPTTGKISASGRKPTTVVTLGDGSTVGTTRGQSGTRSHGGSSQGGKSASAGIITAGGGATSHGGGSGKSHAPTSGGGGNHGAGIVSAAGGAAAAGGGAAGATVHGGGGGRGGGNGGGRGGK